jgi:hypothetical protein
MQTMHELNYILLNFPLSSAKEKIVLNSNSTKIITGVIVSHLISLANEVDSYETSVLRKNLLYFRKQGKYSVKMFQKTLIRYINSLYNNFEKNNNLKYYFTIVGKIGYVSSDNIDRIVGESKKEFDERINDQINKYNSSIEFYKSKIGDDTVIDGGKYYTDEYCNKNIKIFTKIVEQYNNAVFKEFPFV